MPTSAALPLRFFAVLIASHLSSKKSGADERRSSIPQPPSTMAARCPEKTGTYIKPNPRAQNKIERQMNDQAIPRILGIVENEHADNGKTPSPKRCIRAGDIANVCADGGIRPALEQIDRQPDKTSPIVIP
jgi:hypothetical protein